MTPFEQEGHTSEDVFVVMDNRGNSFNLGEKVKLKRDDGSFAPLFVNDEGRMQYIDLTNLRKVAPLGFAPEELGSKYLRTIHTSTGSGQVDVYDVLEAFNVTCPAMQHALKKMLCAGLRGHKDLESDKKEAIKSIERSIQLDKNREV